MPKLSLEYLEKLWKLCEENDTELVLLAIPYGSEADIDRYLKRQGMNLTLEDWARERGIPFRFYQKEEPELIDFATDFRDQTHLNTEGAREAYGGSGCMAGEGLCIAGSQRGPRIQQLRRGSAAIRGRYGKSKGASGEHSGCGR